MSRVGGEEDDEGNGWIFSFFPFSSDGGAASRMRGLQGGGTVSQMEISERRRSIYTSTANRKMGGETNSILQSGHLRK